MRLATWHGLGRFRFRDDLKDIVENTGNSVIKHFALIDLLRFELWASTFTVYAGIFFYAYNFSL